MTTYIFILLGLCLILAVGRLASRMKGHKATSVSKSYDEHRDQRSPGTLVESTLRRPLYKSHVFVSYQSNDLRLAQALTHCLQKMGLRAWWDRDSGEHDPLHARLQDGRGAPLQGTEAEIDSRLRSEVELSIVVVAITSAHTLASVWVRKEIQSANETRTPVFFWHVPEADEVDRIRMRRTGTRLDSSAVDEQIAKFFRDSSEEYLTSRASAAFSRELAGKAGANIVGHTIEIGSNIDAVCSEVKSLIEVCELILHKGEEVTPDSIQAAWPEYDRLCREGEKLTATIEAQFGRRISVGRVLVGEYFRLKRPYILGRIRHLERLLNDEEFRAQEFERRRDSR